MLSGFFQNTNCLISDASNDNPEALPWLTTFKGNKSAQAYVARRMYQAWRLNDLKRAVIEAHSLLQSGQWMF